MSKGLGKALEQAIKDEDVRAHAKKSASHIFLNNHRRTIFSRLTMTPCIGIAQLAESTGIVHNTVEFHLEALVKAGFVAEHRIGRKRIYYPRGLVKEEEIDFFYVLNLPRLSNILFKVIEGSGMTQGEIADFTGDSRQTIAKALGDLKTAGLVTSVTDGKNTRYFTTTMLPERAEEFYQRSKDFSEYILRKLTDEGGKDPVIAKKSLDRIMVEAGFASGRFVVEIGINPFITCRSC